MSQIPTEQRAHLVFQTGPVQDFIAQARKTQDLWAGSWLLSFLTTRAIAAVVQAGGKIVYPASEEHAMYEWHEQDYGMTGRRARPERGNDLLIPNVPNRFVALVTKDRAEAIALGAAQAVRGLWLKITQSVRRKVDEAAGSQCAGWDIFWDEQVQRFPVLDWAVQPWLPVKELLMGLRRETGAVPPLEDISPFASLTEASPLDETEALQLAVAEWRFAAVKNGRTFAAWSLPGDRRERGVPKDHLDGRSEVLGGAQWQLFWTRLRERKKHAFKGKQTYGAVTVVKRLFAECWLGPALGWQDWRPEFVSVPEIARAIDAEPGDPQAEDEQGGYYAMLAMDGDDMGLWVSGCRESTDQELNPKKTGYHRRLSERLTQFSREDAERIVLSHGGQPVYCGGDDVLAMLPAETAYACAQALAAALSARLPGATASAGISIGHVRSPMQHVIQAARDAERTAKGNPGKGAVCVRILKRSGESVEFTASLKSGAAAAWEDSARGRHSISQGFVHDFVQHLQPLLATPWAGDGHIWMGNWPEARELNLREIIRLELVRLLERQSGLKAAAAAQKADEWMAGLLDGPAGLGPRDFMHFWLARAFLNRLEKPSVGQPSKREEAA